MYSSASHVEYQVRSYMNFIKIYKPEDINVPCGQFKMLLFVDFVQRSVSCLIDAFCS